MKAIITFLLTLAAALFAASVHGQAGLPIFTVNANSTSNLPVNTVSIDCSKQQNIAVEWTCNLNGTDVTNVGVRFIGCAIPGTRPTTPTLADGFYMATLTAGTTPVVVLTNFNVKGYSRLDLTWTTNGSATMILTNQIRYFPKRAF